MKEITQEEKEKYVRGFKNFTLPLKDYARKMSISSEDLKQWLKEDRGEALFGKIELSEVTKAPVNIAPSKTAIKFERDTIKIELKENFDKKFKVYTNFPIYSLVLFYKSSISFLVKPVISIIVSTSIPFSFIFFAISRCFFISPFSSACAIVVL